MILSHLPKAFILSTMLFSTLPQSAEAKPVAARKIAHESYNSYFESNQSGLTGRRSLLVLENQKSFDRVFGAAATMGENRFLPDATFRTKLVLAVIKRGSSITDYRVQSLKATGDRLVMRYSANAQAPSSATYASPLIVATDKKSCRSVVFVENGQIVGTLKLNPQNSKK